MKPRYLKAILTIMLLTSPFGATSRAQDDKVKKAPGADFHHPIYLPVGVGKPSVVKGVGDALLHPDIVYILRLEAGQQLSATLSSALTAAQEPSMVALSLIDGRATSFEDAQVLDRKLGTTDRKQKPGTMQASIAYVAPDTGDYYLVAEFHGGGIIFQLTATAETAVILKHPSTCVTGLVTSPTYLSPGVPDSLISDITVGDRTKADPPDEHNRHFCLTTCEIRPPTSLVLTTKLQDAFGTKKEIQACWDPSNTITEISSPH
jgi:hypothetical protein